MAAPMFIHYLQFSAMILDILGNNLQGLIQNMVSWGADTWVEDFDKNNATDKNSACLNIGPASCSFDKKSVIACFKAHLMSGKVLFAYICVH
jgi:hypothetical protein